MMEWGKFPTCPFPAGDKPAHKSAPQLRHDVLPTTLVTQHQFDHFANRATTARRLRDVMRCGSSLGTCIGDGDSQATLYERRHIGQIVADIRRLSRGHALVSQQRLEGGQL